MMLCDVWLDRTALVARESHVQPRKRPTLAYLMAILLNLQLSTASVSGLISSCQAFSPKLDCYIHLLVNQTTTILSLANVANVATVSPWAGD